METKVDQVAAVNHALAKHRQILARNLAVDQVQLHAVQPCLQVGHVGRLHAAGNQGAASVHGAVDILRHQLSLSVKSTTRATSSRVVTPSRTRRKPSSTREWKPAARAAFFNSRVLARRAVISSSSGVIFSSSMMASRPL